MEINPLLKRKLFLNAMGLAPEWSHKDRLNSLTTLTQPSSSDLSSKANETPAQPSRVNQKQSAQHTAYEIDITNKDFTQRTIQSLDYASIPIDQSSAPMLADNSAAISAMDWTSLEQTVSTCQRCNLCHSRTQTVFGTGPHDADWMVIGEAPGEHEDKQGQPFVGQAGKLLDNMLHAIGLNRTQNVYIANILKCRPPGNRNPHPDEIAYCTPYLQRQIALLKPKCILLMGRFAAQTLLNTDISISKLRGQIHLYENVPAIVTYHPAYLLRSPQEKSKAWADLYTAKALMQKEAVT